MRPAQVFISYRRDDAAGYARSVYDELAKHFGDERVFIDVDDIHAGQAFSEVIEREVGASQVLVVLVGRRWQGERDGAAARLHEPGDLVRREVSAGLANGARVIPVLLDGTAMPTESQLPDDLRALAGRNALAIDNARFAADMNRLVASVREALGEPALPVPRPTAAIGKRGVQALVGVALVVGAVAVWSPWEKPGGPSSGEPAVGPDRAVAVVATARPDINGLWQAEVSYDWPNAHHVERFDFRSDADKLHGSASFLQVPRGLLEGRTEPGGVRFVTRTTETTGSGDAETVHRYQGRWADGEIRFVMQTEGGSSSHVPVEFVARRLAPAPASAPGR